MGDLADGLDKVKTDVLDVWGQVLGARGYGAGFSEKLPEVFPMSSRNIVSRMDSPLSKSGMTVSNL